MPNWRIRNSRTITTGSSPTPIAAGRTGSPVAGAATNQRSRVCRHVGAPTGHSPHHGAGERLERDGVIAGYTVRLAQDLTQQGLQAFVGLTLQPRSGRSVEERLARMPEVQQLCAVSGEFDYVLLLRTDSAVRMNTVLDDIRNVEGVVKTTTSVALAWKIDRI
jgi:hypothetical protein